MKPTDPIPFGKHKGTPLKDVPRDYLEWLIKQDGFEAKNPALTAYIKTGVDVADPAKSAAAEKKTREDDDLEAELLGGEDADFRAFWKAQYGNRLREENSPFRIPYLRIASTAWRVCALTFDARLRELRKQLEAATPSTGDDRDESLGF